MELNILVYFTIILIVLLGFCGLAIDVGRMELRTNQLQAAADAAALAAAAEVLHSSTYTSWQSYAQAAADADIATYETENGIPSTSPSTVQLGASSGPYMGDYSTVQVTVTQALPTIFMGLISSANRTVTLRTRAVAQIPPCMFFTGSPNFSSTYAYWITSGGVQVQSLWACPLYTRTGTMIDYFSNYRFSQTRSSESASSSSFGGTSNPPIYNVPALADPLAYITAPMAGGCMGPISRLNQATNASINFTPGTYCGRTAPFTPGPIGCGEVTTSTTPAMDIEGTYTAAVNGVGCPSQGGGPNLNYANGGNCTSNPVVNFAPGLYVFEGGVNFTCVTVTGRGVTMYFTKGSTVGYGQLRMTASTWKITAPTDAINGGIPGISIMNDRNWTPSASGSVDDFQFWYSSWYADGAVYLTSTGLYDFNTPMYCPNYLNIVAANMYIYDANIKPAVNYATLPGGNPLHTVITLVQ